MSETIIEVVTAMRDELCKLRTVLICTEHRGGNRDPARDHARRRASVSGQHVRWRS